jgi:hemerythrin-like domain-containing protein
MMLIVKALSRDHRALEGLLSELSTIPKSEKLRRLMTFAKLQTLLQAHSRAEEEVVYRRLRKLNPEEARVPESYEEHHVCDVLLQELASSNAGTAHWTAKAMVLEALLRQHIKTEELDVFPLITAGFDEAALAGMDKEFRALKNERVETLLGPLRSAMPAFAGRAAIDLQAGAGRLARRGQLYLLHAFWRRQTHDGQLPVPRLGGR